jgi:hypothetical protein
MSARVYHIRNPLAPSLGMRALDVAPGVILTRALAEAEWKLPGSTFLLRRDVLDCEIDWSDPRYAELFVRRAEWDGAPLGDGDCMVLVTLPQGGGGSGSQIVQIIASIVIAIAAFVIAGPLGAGAVLATEVGLGASAAAVAVAEGVVASAIIVAGKLILSAVLPLPKPKSPASSLSPSYTIGLQSNQARLTQPVPEWFGLYNQVPDLRSQPYADYTDSFQNVYELFCLGKGSYQIQEMRVGNNVFAALADGVLSATGTYPEIEWQIAGPEEALTLFPDNVVTSSEVGGIELLGTNEVGYEETAWFVTNPPGTKTNRICVDMSLPGGLYHLTNSGNYNRAEVDFKVTAQEIDDFGNTLGAAFVLMQERLDLYTPDPQRISFSAKCASARYQVQAERTNAKGTSSSISDRLVWMALRAFLPSDEHYGDCTMIAIKAQATQNLNGTSSDQFNMIAMRVLTTPVLIDGTWQWSATPQPTRSIGAAAYYLLTSQNNAQVDPSFIDGAWLLRTEATWQSRGDTFDGGFDSQASFWDMLNQVMNVGRAQALPGPLISFVRDEPKTIYRCAFSARQMVKDTFTINYVFFDQNTADAANVSYIDEADWQPNTVFCALPGSTLDAGTAPQVTAFGMVSRDQVFRTYMYTLAASCYRREFPTFDTELDGRVCQRGDLVKLSHVVPQWGASADVIALEEDDDGDLLTLSEPWSIDTAGPMVTLSTPDGYLAGPATVAIVDNGSTSHRAIVRLTEACEPDQGLYSGQPPRDWGLWGDTVRGLQRERPKCVMQTSDVQSVDALIVSVTPQASLRATVACAVDNPLVYTADEGGTPARPAYPPNDSTEDLQISGLTIREVLASSGLFTSTRDAAASICTVTISGAPDAVSFQYRTRAPGANSWAPLAGTTPRSFSFRAGKGNASVQVRAVGSSSIGAWLEADTAAEGAIEVVNATFDFSRYGNSGNLALLSAAWRH